MSEERIMHAAVIALSGQILLGRSHADCFHQGKNMGVDVKSAAKAQGFFTNLGRFVDREVAFNIAKQAGQIAENLTHDILFSEDLWSPTNDGKHSYDYVKGYYL